MVGQKAMAEVLGISDRQVRNLKKAGDLDWIEQFPTGAGGRANDGFICQSGTAFKDAHKAEVRQAHVDALGDHARKAGQPAAALAELRRGLEGSTILADGGCGTSAQDVTEAPASRDPRPG